MGKSTQQTETPENLYNAALTLLEQSQPDQALLKARKLWTLVQNEGVASTLPALNLLGEISVEQGDSDAARQFFQQAVALDPEGIVPEMMGGGAEKFMWLAQLCEEGGSESVMWFEKGIMALQHEIAALAPDMASDIDAESLIFMRTEKKRKLASALCGMIEVYMTDLSWEDDAEARCESLITEAMAVEDETSPEVLQTLASVRLSQQRQEDARAALMRSIDTWKDLDLDDPAVPDFATRISLSRLLMEAELEESALRVLERLVQEDDQSVEAWYLGGWCQRLIATVAERSSSIPASAPARREGGGPDQGLAQRVKNILKGSRDWLETSIKLYEQLEYKDERLYEHAKELVASLDMVLGPGGDKAKGGGDEEDSEWDGVDDDFATGRSTSDEQMNDI